MNSRDALRGLVITALAAAPAGCASTGPKPGAPLTAAASDQGRAGNAAADTTATGETTGPASAATTGTATTATGSAAAETGTAGGTGPNGASSQPGQSVHLRFGWKPGMVARIETTFEQTRLQNGAPQKSGGSSPSTMRVTSVPEGLLIRNTDVDTSQLPRIPGIDYAALAAALPGMIVDADGGIVRFEGMEQAAQALQQTLQNLVKDAPPELAQFVQAAFSPENYAAQLADDWSGLVAAWSGADLQYGKTYETRQQSSLPMLGDAQVDMLSVITMEGPTFCDEADREARCVTLEIVTRPDSAQLAPLLASYAQQLAATATDAPGAMSFEDLEMETHLTLVTEPDGLVPHRLLKEKHFKGTLKAAMPTGDAPGGAIERNDRTLSVYHYQR